MKRHYVLKRVGYIVVFGMLALSVLAHPASAATPPPLVIFEKGAVTITAGDTNNNGRIESSREGAFKVALKSSGYSMNKAYGVTAVITTTDSKVNITNASCAYGDMDVGTTKSPTNNRFAFKLTSASFTGTVKFNMAVLYKDADGTGYALVERFKVNILMERGSASSTAVAGASTTAPQDKAASLSASEQNLAAATNSGTAYMAIVDASGTAVNTVTLKGGDKVTLFSTGYDSSGKALGSILSTWNATTDIGSITSIPAASALFEALKRGTGYITAVDAAGHGATTGLIEVLNSDGPVAAYSFDENTGYVANDESGNQNGGSMKKPDWVSGRIGSGLSFAAQDNVVNCGHGANLNIRDSLTVTADFKNGSDQATRTSTIVSKDGGRGYQLKVAKGKACASLWINGVKYTVYGTGQILSGEWHNLAVTYDGSVINLYLDGNLEACKNVKGRIDDNAEYGLLIGGAYLDMANEYAMGLIDNVRIYDKALGADDIILQLKTPSPGRAPLVPTCLKYPGAGNTDISCTFSFVSRDPDGDRLKYIADWDDGRTDTTPYLISGNAASLSHKWQGTGTYDVRTRTIDETGLTSGWCGSYRINIFSNPNRPPRIDIPLKSMTLAGGRAVYLVLSGYASDSEDEKEGLVWTVSNVDTSLVHCFISRESGVTKLNLQPLKDRVGQNLITLTVTDTGGLSDSRDLLIQVK
jgi:hypothetical protein